ncbi:MAG: PASTA domain-containing protein [Treponema sp.]|nr:PASTA domain-containing protein [Treponema sp.]
MGKKIGFNLKEQVSNLAYGGKPLLFTIIVTFIVMLASCIAVFFSQVHGAEQVMVPNVVGKSLTTALLEMQQKELYAKINLQYSDMPGDINTILSQNPEAGAIVKAYRRVTLTVSRGVAIDRIEDYQGQNIESILPRLRVLFDGDSSMVKIASPVYKQDSSEQGTILAQFPEAGTFISDATTLHFIVSSGDKVEMVNVPEIEGMNAKQILKAMEESKIIFDFTQAEADDTKKWGTAVYQDMKGNTVQAYSHVNVQFAVSPVTESDTAVSGILSHNLLEYPYPIPVRLEATDKNGKTSVLVSFSHPGNNITIPYSVTRGTTLMLYVKDRVEYQETIE